MLVLLDNTFEDTKQPASIIGVVIKCQDGGLECVGRHVKPSYTSVTWL